LEGLALRIDTWIGKVRKECFGTHRNLSTQSRPEARKEKVGSRDGGRKQQKMKESKDS
jgi:hypothetical protein